MIAPYKVYALGEDGDLEYQGTFDASSHRDAIDACCDQYRLNDEGMIALAPGESLPAGEIERQFVIDGVEYDFR